MNQSMNESTYQQMAEWAEGQLPESDRLLTLCLFSFAQKASRGVFCVSRSTPYSSLIFVILLIGFGLFLSSSAFAQPSPEELFQAEGSSCKVCHGKEKVDYASSIHDQRGITCVDCHGGDATSLKEKQAMSPAAGFQPKPDKKGIAQLCASCHNDERMMTPYGLPTDQYDQYRISVHGSRLFENNDMKVAVCTDCHQTHKTLPHTNPQSTTHVANVPDTCAKCHSDAGLMMPYRIPTDQYDKYVQSVHGQALLERGNTAAPNCARCHGTHGAAPPGVADIAKVCGQCHNNTRNYFNRSPHKEPMDAMNISECASCHNHHDIQVPTLALFDTSCEDCHDRTDPEFRRGQEIKTAIVDARAALDEAQRAVTEAKRHGVYTAEHEFTLEEARTNLLRVIPMTHTLSLSQVKEFTDKAHGEAEQVKLDLHNYFESLRFRKVGLGLVWVFLLGTIAALVWRQRRADREWEQGRGD